MSSFMIQLAYGGKRNTKFRYFGPWASRVAAQEVADRWTYRVSSCFFGDVIFTVIEIEKKTISIKELKRFLQDEGMN